MKINNINFNMFGVIEFREDEHDKNVKLLHNIKRDVCSLLKNMMEDEMGERRYPIFDERRGRGNMKGDSRGNIRMNNPYDRESYYHDGSMDNRYNY